MDLELDYKKINPTPETKFEAIDFMLSAQQNLIEALFILKSIKEWDEDLDEFHKKSIDVFLNKFK